MHWYCQEVAHWYSFDTTYLYDCPTLSKTAQISCKSAAPVPGIAHLGCFTLCTSYLCLLHESAVQKFANIGWSMFSYCELVPTSWAGFAQTRKGCLDYCWTGHKASDTRPCWCWPIKLLACHFVRPLQLHAENGPWWWPHDMVNHGIHCSVR